MGRKFKLLLIFCLSTMIIGTPLYAGAWAQQKGHYYTKLTYIYSDANRIFGNNSPALFEDNALYFYGEYGLTNRATLVLSTPFFKHSVNEANFLRGETSGYFSGDLELQAKYQFLARPVVASLLGGAKIPLGYEIADIPPLGNGETDFDAKLLLGLSLYPVPAYLTGDVGYRFRGGDFVDEIQYNFEAGYTVLNDFLLRFLINGITSTRSATGESNLFGFPLSQEKTRLGGGVILLLSPHIDLDVTYLSTTAGENIPKTTEVFVGIAIKR
ncbi:MAG: hypothetical protein H6628_18545 [Calditrichae bacterium]|nr:hypothetical protein [Calditrichia bacterium]